MTAIYIPAWPNAAVGAVYCQTGIAWLWQWGPVVWQSGKYLPLWAGVSAFQLFAYQCCSLAATWLVLIDGPRMAVGIN